MFSDPEVHIGLENLQQFPAFGSPPHHSPPGPSAEFQLGPGSPLSSSPASGNAAIAAYSLIISVCDEGVFNLVLSLLHVSDVAMFPSLNANGPSFSVGSVEEDSPCMSFAQVNPSLLPFPKNLCFLLGTLLKPASLLICVDAERR